MFEKSENPFKMINITIFGYKFIFRTTITEIAEEGPSKLRSLDDDSEITFQLGLILRYVGVPMLT